MHNLMLAWPARRRTFISNSLFIQRAQGRDLLTRLTLSAPSLPICRSTKERRSSLLSRLLVWRSVSQYRAIRWCQASRRWSRRAGYEQHLQSPLPQTLRLSIIQRKRLHRIDRWLFKSKSPWWGTVRPNETLIWAWSSQRLRHWELRPRA